MEACIQKPVNEKLKETSLYILDKCAEGKFFGKTILFKLLYFSDFNFYKLHYISITGENYRKLPFGPAPCSFDEIMDNLSGEGKIKIIVNKTNGSYKFKVLKEPKIELLNGEEIKIIDKVIEKIGHCNATEISKLSHSDTPWQVTNDKEIINYDLVFYRDKETINKVE